MSFNGSGTFVVNSAGQPVVTGTTITSTAFNLLTADLATGLTTTLTKDGQSTPTANIPMGSFKLTGLANGTAAADAVRMSQLQSNGANYITVAGTADVITGGVTPALTAYAAGNEFVFVVGSTNTTSVTLNVDGLGAKAITKDGTGALTAGDLTAGDVALVVYDGTRFQLVSASYGVSSWAGGTTGLTPASATTGAVSLAGTLVVANGGTGAATLTANNVLLGNGTSAVQVVAPGTSGNLLTSDGTTWASTAPSGGGVTTFTAGTTGFTPSSATSGAVTLSGTLAVANGGTGGTTSTGTGAVVLATNPALVGYTVNTASGVDGEWTTAGLAVYKDGVTPQHDAPLHVMSGTAGTITASSSGDELVLEGAGQTGMSILTPDNQNSCIYFGTPTATNTGAQILYSYNAGAPVFNIGTLTGSSALMNFYVGATTQMGQWNTTGLTCFASGVTAQHDGVLHVMSGTAGAVTASASADELVVEGAGVTGVSIIAPDANASNLYFGSTTQNNYAQINAQYNAGSPQLVFGTVRAGGSMILRTGNDTAALTIDSSQIATFTKGVVVNPSAGNATLARLADITVNSVTRTMGLGAQTTTGVSTSATAVLGYVAGAGLAMVYGADGGTRFVDLVFFYAANGLGNVPTVVSAKSVNGSPAARTYTSDSNTGLRVAMASGTYAVIAAGMQVNQ